MRLLILVFAALPLVAQTDPLEPAIAAARAYDSLELFCNGDDDPMSVVCRSVAMKDAPTTEVVAMIAGKLSVSRESARAIAMALVPLLRASNEPLDGETRRVAEAALTDALRSERNRIPMITAMAHLAGAGKDRRAALDALAPLIGDDTRAAIAAADVLQGEDALRLLASIFARHPDDVGIAEAIASHAWSTRVQAAIGPLRITRNGVEARKGVMNANAVAVQLRAIAWLGLPELLLAAYEALPPTLRHDSTATDDVRVDVAAAALLTGKTELAKQLVAAVRGPDDRVKGPRMLLEAATGTKHDPFDVIVGQFSNALGNNTAGVRGQLFARFLEQHGYAALAAEVRAESESVRLYDDQPIEPLRDDVAVLQHFIDASGSAAAYPSPPAAAPSSLAAPRIVPFTEHRLADAGSASASTIIDCSDAQRVARTTNLPPNVSPIRMERQGNDVIAVVISSAVDPVGELGLGGYWVLRSTDGGSTWREYYTGLRQNMPYVIPPASQLPLLHGDRLRIEVEVKELDTSSITFPPVGLRLSRSERGLYLDLPWSELARDSDDDGLTDLLEERLTTDPNELDTDGDGVADGEDTLPRVPRSATRAVAAEVLAAALDGFGLGGGAIVAGIGEGEHGIEALQQSCEIRASRVGDRVLFLIGDPAQFAPLTMNRRTIVLTANEVGAYTARFGVTYPAAILHFVIDPAGTRALIELNQSWTGITYLMEKTSDGRWNVTVISSWIT